jgi:Mce-associated membrane protein
VTTPLTSSNPQGPDVSVAPQTSRDPGDSRLRWGMAAFLGLVLVVCLVLLVLEVTTLRPKADADQENQDARSAAVSAAERFTVQFNTYDSGDLPAYEKALTKMMSPKFKESFEKAITQVEASIKQGKVQSKGQVLKSAVASQDADSAEVLVVSDAEAKTIYDPSVARHFRWQISLVKINGRWLVDNYEPVR